MTFTDADQVKPVGIRYNLELGTIEVTGFNMAASQKFRNIGRNGQAALVVDDIASAVRLICGRSLRPSAGDSML